MTRKDYELIAGAIANLRGQQLDGGALTNPPTLREVASELATELATTNPRFDRARFLTACGVN
jgi:hypothetical protein